MKPRWYQEEAVTAALAYLGKGKGNTIVVSPTGSGKSLMLSMLVKQLKGEVLILSHVQEILEQNFNTLRDIPDLGLYSSGLGVKLIKRVTIAGIQSVWRNPKLFKNVSIVLIDECHMINNEGMYKTFLDALDVPYIGLTATPYRLKSGLLYGKGKIFDSVCYEAPIDKLTEQGYLSPIVTYGSKDELDLTGIKTQGGDFKLSDMSDKYDRDGVTNKIVRELTQYKTTYKHWLAFCIDIKHAEHVAEALNNIGITSEAVHSDSPRDQAILDFKAGKIQCLTNVNILTVGFDYPEIDLIAMLRPTKSPVLHVQSIGRGLRVANGKKHCLIKDFAGNLSRLGMIDNVLVTEPGVKGKGGVNPFMKTCPKCDKIVHPSVRTCECGHKFKFEHHLSTKSYTAIDWHEVSSVFYNIHHSSPPSLKVSYMCGVRVYNEWVLLDHSGYAKYKAIHWAKNRWRGEGNPPESVKELLQKSEDLWKPNMIQVEEGGKYPKIVKTR